MIVINYTEYDFLWNEPYFIQGIGSVKCPTLLDIRKMTYSVFVFYINLILCKKEDLLSILQIGLSSDTEVSATDTYSILLHKSPEVLLSFIRTFISNDFVKFNYSDMSFEIYDKTESVGEEETVSDNTDMVLVGKIDKQNFDNFRDDLSTILGLRKKEKKLKFKNEQARLIYEKIERERNKHQKINNDYDLDNMILKYCTHNKVGINMLNVGQLTYYQFIKLFNEYSYGRQVDYSDMIAGNTFSYKNAEDYKSNMWIEKIKETNC